MSLDYTACVLESLLSAFLSISLAFHATARQQRPWRVDEAILVCKLNMQSKTSRQPSVVPA